MELFPTEQLAHLEPTIMGPVDNCDGRGCPGCHELPCWSAHCLEETARFPRQSCSLLGQGPYLLLMMAHGGGLNKCLFSDWITRGLWWACSIAAGVGFSAAAQPHPASIKLFREFFWEKINKQTHLKWVFYFECLQHFSFSKCSLKFRKIKSRFIVFHTQNFPVLPPELPHPDFPSEQNFLSFCKHARLGTFWATSVTCGLYRNLDELCYSGSQCRSHLEDVGPAFSKQVWIFSFWLFNCSLLQALWEWSCT